MRILCKIFGHKPDLGNNNRPIIKLTGWEQDYNSYYKFVEFSRQCERCGKNHAFQIYSQPKKINHD